MGDTATHTPPSPTRAPLRIAFFLFVAAVVVGLVVANVVAKYYASLGIKGTPAPNRVGRNAPFITSPDLVIDKMVEMAELTPDDVVYDLGCGDGRIVITAALKSGCRGVGFDIDPVRVAEARENVKLHGVEHLVEIREQDIFTVDMSPASAAMFYLLPWMNKKLIPQFQQMKPGSRVVSHDFALGDIKDVPADQTILFSVEDPIPTDHYVYRWNVPIKIPAKPKRP